MAQFDPSSAGVETVLSKLEKADADERSRILAAEAGPDGKRRKSILSAYGIDPDVRLDATGRALYPWEVTGKDMADADRQPAETDEERAAREAQAEQDAQIEAAQASNGGDQGGADPAGTGIAPSADAGDAAGTY